eukprot:2669291-Pyramimonas_sp.AAC.1
MVNITRKTWYPSIAVSGGMPAPADQDFAVRNLQAKVYQAIYKEGSKWAAPNSQAGQPSIAGQAAASSDAAEKCDTFTS